LLFHIQVSPSPESLLVDTAEPRGPSILEREISENL